MDEIIIKTINTINPNSQINNEIIENVRELYDNILKIKGSEYYQKNKERILAKQKEYKKANAEKIKEYKRQYIANNREKLYANYKKYYDENKEEINRRRRGKNKQETFLGEKI